MYSPLRFGALVVVTLVVLASLAVNIEGHCDWCRSWNMINHSNSSANATFTASNVVTSTSTNPQGCSVLTISCSGVGTLHSWTFVSLSYNDGSSKSVSSGSGTQVLTVTCQYTTAAVWTYGGSTASVTGYTCLSGPSPTSSTTTPKPAATTTHAAATTTHPAVSTAPPALDCCAGTIASLKAKIAQCRSASSSSSSSEETPPPTTTKKPTTTTTTTTTKKPTTTTTTKPPTTTAVEYCKVPSSMSEFNAVLEESTVVVAVDFYASWCNPCESIMSKYQSLAVQYYEKLTFMQVEVDAHSDISSAHNITEMPTFCFFKNGSKLQSFVGNLPSQLESQIAQLAASG